MENKNAIIVCIQCKTSPPSKAKGSDEPPTLCSRCRSKNKKTEERKAQRAWKEAEKKQHEEKRINYLAEIMESGEKAYREAEEREEQNQPRLLLALEKHDEIEQRILTKISNSEIVRQRLGGSAAKVPVQTFHYDPSCVVASEEDVMESDESLEDTDVIESDESLEDTDVMESDQYSEDTDVMESEEEKQMEPRKVYHVIHKVLRKLKNATSKRSARDKDKTLLSRFLGVFKKIFNNAKLEKKEFHSTADCIKYLLLEYDDDLQDTFSLFDHDSEDDQSMRELDEDVDWYTAEHKIVRKMFLNLCDELL